MDYLVFAIGMLLLSATVGAGFLHLADASNWRWLLAGLAFVGLAMCGWADIVLFASGSSTAMTTVRSTAATIATAAFGFFAICPLVRREGSVQWFKIATVLATTGVVLYFGMVGLLRDWIAVLPALAGFAAGWSAGSVPWPRHSFLKFGCGMIFLLVTAAQLMPDAVATAFDVAGQKSSAPRVGALTLLGLGTVSALAITCLVWSLRLKTAAPGKSLRSGLGARIIVAAFVLTLGYGAWLAHWLGSLAQEEETSRLLSAIRLGASTLEAQRIVRIDGRAEEAAGEDFFSQHLKLKKVHQALPDTRFVYLVGKRNNRLVFLADAEDPASPDFSPPGMIYENQPEKWQRGLAGVSSFEGPDTDHWGTWFTAIEPVFSVDGGQVVAAMGVDYPAREWLRPVASRRAAAMGMTFSVACFLLALQAFNIIASEKGRRVDQLSERLGDAMDAAELDTWEWFPKTGKIVAGPRLAALLGYEGADHLRSLSQVWKRIHPKERYHLRRLLKSGQDASQHVSEAEIGLLNAKGDYVWCMVRGRMVDADEKGGALRMAGTILNIDASHKARVEIEAQRKFALRVMQSVPTSVAVVAPTGAIRYANSAFAALAGRAPDELVGVSLDALIQGGDQLGTEGTEASLHVKSGQQVPVQAYRAYLHDAGEEAGSILSLVDLSSIKAAEADLKASRAEARRLALVAKRTDNAVVITDREGRIEWVNEGFTRISGYTKDDVLGRTPGSVLQGAASDNDARAWMKQRIRAGEGFEADIVNYSKSGKSYVVSIECQPLLDRNNQLTGFMAIERDVTRDRRSARLLEAVAAISTTLLSPIEMADELWSRILEQLGQAADVERSYLFRSKPHSVTGEPAMSQLTEWNSGLAEPQINNPELQDVAFGDAGFGRWLEILSSGSEIAGLVSTFPDSERPLLQEQSILSLVAVPVFAGGTFWGFMGFDACSEEREWQVWEIALLKSAAANIGLRLVAEQESEALRSARDLARDAADSADRANRAKGTFLATMSHEIRTPLNAVIGMASLMETTPLNAVQQDYAETILRSSHFLLDLINDILDYSRIESGRIEMDDTPFALAEICKGAFDVVKAGSLGKQLEIICRIDPGLPKWFRGDPGRVRQVLVNLLGNAIKFTPQGFVSLMVSGRRISEGNWYLDCDVNDSGIGIAPESLDRLFKPFTQEDSSTTRRFGGSGLGLAICKRLAELMEGDITVTSQPGQGSTFRLSVSLKETPELEAEARPPAVLPKGWNPRALVVDDNALNRRVLQETLANFGLRCQTAESAALALDMWAEQGPFDLVLTDYQMPAMDGVELVTRMRRLPGADGCRFVLIGSESTYANEVRELFDGITTKPVWPKSLAATLAGLFPSSAAVADPAETAGRFDQLRVLVAEDNTTNQKVIRLLLKQLGIVPEIVGNGLEAVEAIRAKTFDVLLLDIQMPVMDGLQACRLLKGEQGNHCPLIFALTADAFREDREAAMAAGMDHYLPKPVTLSGLRDAMAMAVDSLPLPI